MFDTSVVRAHSTAARHPLALFTVSVAFHLAVVAAVLLVSITATSLPLDPPNQVAQYHPEAIPTVPAPAGNPNVQRPAQQPASQPRPAAPIPPNQVTAPNVVPDETPVLPDGGTAGSVDAPPGPVGEPWGVPGGVPFSVGEPSAAPARQTASPEPLRPGGEVRSARVLSRVEPRYPQLLANVRLRHVTVVVRCIIDRHGQLRDAQIVQGQFEPFNDAVLEALEQWRFAPGSLRGQAVDTYFELTVNFQMR